MTSADLALLQCLHHRLRQIEQTQQVGDVWTRFAHEVGELLLCIMIGFDQRRVAVGFFNNVEIGALDVFDQCDLSDFFIAEGAQDHRHFCETSLLCCA